MGLNGFRMRSGSVSPGWALRSRGMRLTELSGPKIDAFKFAPASTSLVIPFVPTKKVAPGAGGDVDDFAGEGNWMADSCPRRPKRRSGRSGCGTGRRRRSPPPGTTLRGESNWRVNPSNKLSTALERRSGRSGCGTGPRRRSPPPWKTSRGKVPGGSTPSTSCPRRSRRRPGRSGCGTGPRRRSPPPWTTSRGEGNWRVNPVHELSMTLNKALRKVRLWDRAEAALASAMDDFSRGGQLEGRPRPRAVHDAQEGGRGISCAPPGSCSCLTGIRTAPATPSGPSITSPALSASTPTSTPRHGLLQGPQRYHGPQKHYQQGLDQILIERSRCCMRV